MISINKNQNKHEAFQLKVVRFLNNDTKVEKRKLYVELIKNIEQNCRNAFVVLEVFDKPYLGSSCQISYF